MAENCSQLVIGPNLFDRNPDQKEETSQNRVELNECSDCTLTGLHMHAVRSKEAALKLERCSWCNITSCLITDSGETSVELLKCENCRVSGCLFRSTEPTSPTKHVQVTGGNNNVINDDSR